MLTRFTTTLSAAVALLAIAALPAVGQPDDKQAGDDDTAATGNAAPDVGAPAPTSDTSAGPDLEALRKKYLELRDQLFRSRARAAAVAGALYSSKISVRLEYATGRYYSVDRATVRLDGANVFDDTTGSIANDQAPRFEGFIAPGRHMLSVRIEATGKDDDRFKSATESSFVVEAPAGHDLIVVASARDAGDIPYKWKKKQRGSYKLHVDIDVRAVKRKDSRGKVAGKN